MRQCLDEGTLQSYFDGELSTAAMESATSHLASCAMCAEAARELEEESSLLSMALAPEFDASVPTERLRQRIDAAVADLHGFAPVRTKSGIVAGLLGSFSSLLNFRPQRAFGYAALMAVLVFATIFGIVKLRTPRIDPVTQVANVTPSPFEPTRVLPPTPGPGGVVSSPIKVAPTGSKNSTKGVRPATPRASQATVKLIPGERSYLQTIAKLDSTIKSGEKAMRPTLQVEYERNLAVVDRAIAATRSAAKNNPNDPDAAEFMFAAYQSKVNLLNTIADARDYNRSH